jgi:hypothetical protein
VQFGSLVWQNAVFFKLDGLVYQNDHQAGTHLPLLGITTTPKAGKCVLFENYCTALGRLDPRTAHAGVRLDEAAVKAAGEGIRTASRYRLRNDWIQLLELQAEAARAAGDTATAARARQELDCLRARLTRPTEAWCAAGLLGFL